MKRGFIFVCSFMLIFSVAQVAFAHNIGFIIGYSGFPFSEYNPTHGLKIGVSGDYKFTELFTLSGKIDGIWALGENDGLLTIDLAGKFNVYNKNSLNAGWQLTLKDMLGSYSANIFGIGIGVYGACDLSAKFNIYADLNFPFFLVITEKNKSPQTKFALMIDATLGGFYRINKNFNIGIEGNILWAGGAPLVGIGAKLSYKF